MAWMAVPKSWTSWDYRVFQEGREILLLDRSAIRDRATFRYGGASYTVAKKSFLATAFELEKDDRVVATANRAGFFRRKWEISAEDRVYALAPTSILGRGYQVLHGDREVAPLAPERVWGRSLSIDAERSVPFHLLMFALFLVTTAWRQSQAAGS